MGGANATDTIWIHKQLVYLRNKIQDISGNKTDTFFSLYDIKYFIEKVPTWSNNKLIFIILLESMSFCLEE